MARRNGGADGETFEGESVQVPVEAVARALAVVGAEDNDRDSGDDEIAAILARLGGDSKAHVRLYREMKGGKSEFVDRFTPSEWLALDIDGVKAEFGPGDYRIRIYDEKSKVRGNRAFSIANIVRPGTVAVPAPVAPTQPMLTPEAIAGAVATAIVGTLSPLLQSLADSGKKRGEFLAELLQYKQLFAPVSASVPAPQSDPLDMLQKVLAITKDMAPSSGETTTADVFLKLAQEFGPMIAGNLRAQGAAPAGAPAGAPAVGRGVAEGPPPATLPQPQAAPASPSGDDEMSLQLRMSIGFLVAQAAADKDVDLYAEMVLDQLPAEMIEPALTLPDDALLTLLTQYDPRVPQHATWFKRLRASMVELEKEGAEEAKQELTTGKDAGSMVEPGGDATP